MSNKSQKVMAGICPCGCEKLVLYLRLPPPKGVDPSKYFRSVRCYPEGWDGELWYSGQCKMHPMTKKLRDAIYGPDPAPENRLE